MNLKHFKPSEVEGLEPELAVRLDVAREHAGVSFRITSGRRTPKQNKRAGGKPNSSHLDGWGADLAVGVRSSRKRYHLVRGLFLAGFRRVVVYKSSGHVHVDCDPRLPQDVLVVL